MAEPVRTHTLARAPRGSSRAAVVLWFVVAGPVLLLVATGAVTAGVASGSAAQLVLGLAVAVGSVLMLLVVGVGARSVLSSRVHVVDGPAGPELPGSRAAVGLGAAVLATLLVVPGVLVATGVAGGSLVLLAIGVAVLLPAVPTLVHAARGRYRVNRLLLDPDGVHVLAPRRAARVPWDDVQSVATHRGLDVRLELGGPVPWDRAASLGERVWGGRSDPSHLTLTGLSLHSGVQPVADLLALYVARPELRGELGDGTVHDRLSRGDVPPRGEHGA